jgi:hypothetical protein
MGGASEQTSTARRADLLALDFGLHKRDKSRVPAQRGGRDSRVPPPKRDPITPWLPGWRDAALDELKRQADFDLWHDCMEAALAPLRADLERAWAHAAALYRQRSETPPE